MGKDSTGKITHISLEKVFKGLDVYKLNIMDDNSGKVTLGSMYIVSGVKPEVKKGDKVSYHNNGSFYTTFKNVKPINYNENTRKI